MGDPESGTGTIEDRCDRGDLTRLPVPQGWVPVRWLSSVQGLVEPEQPPDRMAVISDKVRSQILNDAKFREVWKAHQEALHEAFTGAANVQAAFDCVAIEAGPDHVPVAAPLGAAR